MIDTRVYDELYEQSMQTINNSGFSYDRKLFSPDDQRFGITVILRLKDKRLIRSIRSMLEEFRSIEPDQYYYPETDLHVTILGLIECHNGFSITAELVNRHKLLIREALEGMSSFSLVFSGISLSPSCILVRGFPSTEVLEQIRDAIRDRYAMDSIEHTIDSRYILKTAHVTVTRFTHPVIEKKRMVEAIKTYRERTFGIEQVTEILLVTNDWCLREHNCELLEIFPLEKR